MNRKPYTTCKKAQKDDVLQVYFDQIKAFPLLNFQEELALSKRIQQGDTEARNQLINANLRLVIKIARPYTAQDVSCMDLIQEGNLGLMHAAERYDHARNVRFSTYASWWIRQFISRYLTNKRRMVRLPQHKEEVLRRIQYTYHNLSQTLMYQPRTEDIANELGIPVKDINYIVNMSCGPLPLELEHHDEDGAGIVELHEDYTYSPERTLLRQSSREGAMRFLNKLKDREKKVLTYRYQLDGGSRYTLKEIGKEMNLSPETIRQIEIKALKKIRSHAEEFRRHVFLEAM